MEETRQKQSNRNKKKYVYKMQDWKKTTSGMMEHGRHTKKNMYLFLFIFAVVFYIG